MDRPLLPFGISVCGIAELDGHCETGASHVLSILDPDHPVPEAFGSFGEHEKLELRFHDIIEATPGQILPQPAHVDAILALGRDMDADADADRHLLVHCHAGISRSTAALVLVVAQALPTLPAEDVLRLIHHIREKAWPNLHMIEMGDARLGRGGSLTAATHALHRLQIERRPQLVAFMEEGGRGREIAAARRHAPLSEP
jgi:predicted protein tyrosine phosphatase